MNHNYNSLSVVIDINSPIDHSIRTKDSNLPLTQRQRKSIAIHGQKNIQDLSLSMEEASSPEGSIFREM